MSNFVEFLFLGMIVLATTLGGYYIYKNNQQKQTDKSYEGYEVIDYRLEGRNLKLLLADTQSKKEKGLMYYRELEGVDGMMFTYSEKRLANFWNRNTFMDLDVYWLSGDEVVGKSFLPSIEKSRKEVVVSSPGEINKVIEIPRS